MLLNGTRRKMDLIEVFCSPNSMMTHTAQKAGLNAERWTKDDFDLETEEGYQAAEQRLRKLRPKRLWLSPECGPFPKCKTSTNETPNKY